MSNICVAGYIGNVEAANNNGDDLLRVSIADNHKVNKDAETVWYSFTLFGKYADKMGQYIKKGSFFIVSGNLVPKIYTTKTNESRMSLNIYNPSLTFGPKTRETGEDQETKNKDYYDDPHDDEMPF